MARFRAIAIAALACTASLACGETATLAGPTAVANAGANRLFAEDFESGTLDAWQDGVKAGLCPDGTDFLPPC
jgi:hypothetical protein